MKDNTPYESLDEAMIAKQLEEEYKDIPKSDSLGIAATLEYVYDSERCFNSIKQYLMTEELKYYTKNNAILFEDANPANQDKQKSIIQKWIDRFIDWLGRVREWFAKVWKAIKEKIETMDIANKAFLAQFEKNLKNCREVKDFEGWDFSNMQPPVPYKFEVDNDLINNKEVPANYVMGAKCAILSGILYDSNAAIPERNFKDINDNLSSILKMRYYNSAVNLSNPDEGLVKKKRTYNVAEQIKYIKNTNRDKRDADRAFVSADTYLKTMEFNIKRLNFSTANQNIVSRINRTLEILKYNIDTLKKAFDIYNMAIVDRNRQAKAICIKALQEYNTRPKNESTVEKPVLRGSSLNDIYSAMA